MTRSLHPCRVCSALGENGSTCGPCYDAFRGIVVIFKPFDPRDQCDADGDEEEGDGHLPTCMRRDRVGGCGCGCEEVA